MRVRLLGTAAGGGFPQWNCACVNCSLCRSDPRRAFPRTQASAAISADGRRWFLVNASPDVRSQIEAFPPLQPPAGAVRGSGIHGVFLTTADLDHSLGLLILREGRRQRVFAAAPVRRALTTGLTIDPVLSHYCGLEWLEPTPELSPVLDADGAPSGLSCLAFPLPGKPPRFQSAEGPQVGDSVGYRFVDDETGAVLVVAADGGGWTATLRGQVNSCDTLLLDGTFWTEDEMSATGAGSLRAGQMAHLPLSGPDGTLAQLGRTKRPRTVLIHINNTNPILREDSAERRVVEAAGVAVGSDGDELVV